MRSGFAYKYAEHYVERCTKTLCSEKLVTMHKVSLRIREDLGPSLLHASPLELPMHTNKEKGDYSCKNLEMGTVYSAISIIHKNELTALNGCYLVCKSLD